MIRSLPCRIEREKRSKSSVTILHYILWEIEKWVKKKKMPKVIALVVSNKAENKTESLEAESVDPGISLLCSDASRVGTIS